MWKPYPPKRLGDTGTWCCRIIDRTTQQVIETGDIAYSREEAEIESLYAAMSLNRQAMTKIPQSSSSILFTALSFAVLFVVYVGWVVTSFVLQWR